MTEALNKRPTEDDGLLISVEDLKANYLFGLDLTDDDGNEMSKKTIEFYIRSAQQWMETEIPGIILCKKEIEEWHDYYLSDYQSYSFLKLFRFPVQSVEAVGFQFPLQNEINEFNPTWFRTQSVGHQVNLLPTQGSISNIMLSQGGSFLPLLYSGTDFVPSLFRVKYTAGFKKGTIPSNILHLIGMKAALGPLNLAGDLIAGAGISSKSLSMDGLSQSISTTASAENSGYGARIRQYTKHIAEEMKTLKSSYSGINMVVS